MSDISMMSMAVYVWLDHGVCLLYKFLSSFRLNLNLKFLFLCAHT